MVRVLTALPVYNEVTHLNAVLDKVLQTSSDVLVVDDGSTDGTLELLKARHDVRVVRHSINRGYGAALRTAFAYSRRHHYQALVTLDGDGQHEPRRVPQFVAALRDADIVSGSRYLSMFDSDTQPPHDRLAINQQITAGLNCRLGLNLTDGFCGFKAYRVASLSRLQLSEDGYAMPLEFWVQASKQKLKIRELAVPRIYLDETRSFGGVLDNATIRLRHYREVLKRSLHAAKLPEPSQCIVEQVCEVSNLALSLCG